MVYKCSDIQCYTWGVGEQNIELREQDRKDLELGIISKEEYRNKWHPELQEKTGKALDGEELFKGVSTAKVNVPTSGKVYASFIDSTRVPKLSEGAVISTYKGIDWSVADSKKVTPC